MNNAYFPQSASSFPTSSPFEVSGGFPFFGASSPACACRAVVTDGRDLIAMHERGTVDAAAHAAAAHVRSSDIAWEGNAATLFRRRLSDCDAQARRMCDDAAVTHRLAWTGGA
ncbi:MULTISPECIES: hypothetical protein [Bifidobacterium]|uniref:hypothetical protein n=1 Tax=Bifidobacterium TaxID=1678 RepID=UPI001BDC0059|nr:MULTISPECIES: hypothetical protein [Bifidobacterium]MBT1161062.1 hypothetical protein [Bifidobacterium sp. SO1]MBW3078138.1 hypothetical protein [Bifidobacterium simiiventris]